MDYSKFRFESAVDWISIEVWTLKLHPAWRVKKSSAGAFSYVEGLDPDTGVSIKLVGTQGKNTPTTRFVIRIQSPSRISEIRRALETIQDRNLSMPVLVRAMEIAFDGYRASSNTTDAELIELTATMLHRICRPTNTNDAPRFYSWRGVTEQRFGWINLIPAITAGQTAMFGNDDDDYIVRGYWKNYDSVRDDAQEKWVRLDLESHNHRARIEVRLQGASLPVMTLDELASFRFESIAKYFKFRRTGDAANALETLIRERTPSLGKVLNTDGASVKVSRRRKTITKTQADELSETARDHLRNLSDRWVRENGRERRKSDRNSGVKESSNGGKTS